MFEICDQNSVDNAAMKFQLLLNAACTVQPRPPVFLTEPHAGRRVELGESLGGENAGRAETNGQKCFHVGVSSTGFVMLELPSSHSVSPCLPLSK